MHGGGTHGAALVAMAASRPFRNEEDGRMLHPGDVFETNAARAAELEALGLAGRRAEPAPADPPPDDGHEAGAVVVPPGLPGNSGDGAAASASASEPAPRHARKR